MITLINGHTPSLSLLIETKVEGVSNAMESKLLERRQELVSVLKAKLETLVRDFKQIGLSLSYNENYLGQIRLVAEALTGQIDEAEQNLPAWISAWQEWKTRTEERRSSAEDKGTRTDVTITKHLIQEGDMLEQQLLTFNLPVPDVLVEFTNALRARLAEAERKTVNEYQLWALAEIQSVREMAGVKASERIKKSLEKGKADPVATAQDKDYRHLLKNNPVFRAKLAELSKVSIPDSQEITSDIAASISNALNSMVSWNGIDELSKCLNRDLLEQRLLKIDEALLRRPLDRIYAEIFDECWRYLEGSEHRIAVAKTAATIEKKPIVFPH